MKRVDRPAGAGRKLDNDLAQLYIEPSERFNDLAEAAGLDRSEDFRNRDLKEMRFAGADLSGYDFSGSDLRGTGVRFSERVDTETKFDDARLDPADQEWIDAKIRDRDRDEMMKQLHELRSEHRDLDAVLGRLSDAAPADILQLQRLKKRKLMLRDQIARLEDQLVPNIIV